MEYTQLIYGLTGAVLFTLAIQAALQSGAALGRIIAINIAGGGLFLLFVTIAYRGSQTPADPIPHALVLTGIVVAVSATALAIAIHRRLLESSDATPNQEEHS